MLKFPALCGLAFLCLALSTAHAQSVDSVAGKVLNFPARLLGHIRSRTADINRQLTQQTEKMLNKMSQQEARMEKKLSATDSAGAKQLFGNSQQEYAALLQKLRATTGSTHPPAAGQYQPYVDSLQGSLSFLK